MIGSIGQMRVHGVVRIKYECLLTIDRRPALLQVIDPDQRCMKSLTWLLMI